MTAETLASLAAELVRPAIGVGKGNGIGNGKGESALAPPPSSAVPLVHVALLDLVRADWGIEGTVGLGGWEAVMRQYLAADREQQQQARRRSGAGGEEGEAEAEAATTTSGADATAAANDEDEAAAAADDPSAPSSSASLIGAPYPPGGYWALPPGTRVRMLRALCHDALDTSRVRSAVEASLEHGSRSGEGVAIERARREAVAEAKREAREAWARERDAQVGALLADAGSAAMTFDEQRAPQPNGDIDDGL